MRRGVGLEPGSGGFWVGGVGGPGGGAWGEMGRAVEEGGKGWGEKVDLEPAWGRRRRLWYMGRGGARAGVVADQVEKMKRAT